MRVEEVLMVVVVSFEMGFREGAKGEEDGRGSFSMRDHVR